MKLSGSHEFMISLLSGLAVLTAVYAWNSVRPYQHTAIQLKAANLSAAPAADLKTVVASHGVMRNPAVDVVITAELRLVFDYAIYRFAEQAGAEVQRYLERNYPANQLSMASDLFLRYANYQHAWAQAEQKSQTETMAMPMYQHASLRLKAMHDLRARYFSAREELALFAIDDEYDRQQLQQLLLGQAAGAAALGVRSLQVADQQIRNYQGYYLQHLQVQ